jgi:hypothetical protein
MLWAQFAPNNVPKGGAFWLGVVIAAIISALIPAVTGGICIMVLRNSRRGQSRTPIILILSIIGALLSGGMAFLCGCLGGLPSALVFAIPIVIVTATAPSESRRRVDLDEYEEDYDDLPRRRQRRRDEIEDEEDDDPRPRRRDYDD